MQTELLEPTNEELLTKISEHADSIVHLVSCVDEPPETLQTLLDYIEKRSVGEIYRRINRRTH